MFDKIIDFINNYGIYFLFCLQTLVYVMFLYLD